MSVQTHADGNLEMAKEHINAAIKCLGDNVISQCQGHDGYITEYREAMADSLHELVKIREKLRT